MAKRTRTLLIIAVILIVCLGGLVIWGYLSGRLLGQAAESQTQSVQTKMGDLVKIINFPQLKPITENGNLKVCYDIKNVTGDGGGTALAISDIRTAVFIRGFEANEGLNSMTANFPIEGKAYKRVGDVKKLGKLSYPDKVQHCAETKGIKNITINQELPELLVVVWLKDGAVLESVGVAPSRLVTQAPYNVLDFYRTKLDVENDILGFVDENGQPADGATLTKESTVVKPGASASDSLSNVMAVGNVLTYKIGVKNKSSATKTVTFRLVRGGFYGEVLGIEEKKYPALATFVAGLTNDMRDLFFLQLPSKYEQVASLLEGAGIEVPSLTKVSLPKGAWIHYTIRIRVTGLTNYPATASGNNRVGQMGFNVVCVERPDAKFSGVKEMVIAEWQGLIPPAIEDTRDASRKADLESIRTAVEMYIKDHNGELPGKKDTYYQSHSTGGTNWKELATLLSPYLPSLPLDPMQEQKPTWINADGNLQTAWKYYARYIYRHDGKGYEIDSIMERDAIAVKNDGGNASNAYEVGSNLNVLANIGW
jgi:hypothetical protein